MFILLLEENSFSWRVTSLISEQNQNKLLWTTVERLHYSNRERDEGGYSLGHLGYVFVSQAHPQVIVFVQQNLLHPGVSHPAGLISEEDHRRFILPSQRLQLLFCFSLTCRRRSRWAAGRSPWPGTWARVGRATPGRSLGPGWSAEIGPYQDPAGGEALTGVNDTKRPEKRTNRVQTVGTLLGWPVASRLSMFFNHFCKCL